MSIYKKVGKYWVLLAISLFVAIALSAFTYAFLRFQVEKFIYRETLSNINREAEVMASSLRSSKELKRSLELFKQINYVKEVSLKGGKGLRKEFIYPDGMVNLTFTVDRRMIKEKAASLAKELSFVEFLITSLLMLLILLSVRKMYLEPLRRVDRDVKRISEGKLKKLSVSTEDEFGRIRKSINAMIDAIKEREAKAGIISQFIYLLTIGKGFNGEFIELMKEVIDVTESDGVILGIKEDKSDKVLIKLIMEEEKRDIEKDIGSLQGIEPYVLAFGKEVEIKDPSEKGVLSEAEEKIGINYVFGIPLKVMSDIKGFIVFFRKTKQPFSESEKDYLRNIARSISISVEVKDLIKSLEENLKREKQLFESSIKSLVRGIEIRDSYTRGHSERVGYYSMRIAQELGLSEEEIKDIYLAGLLHDIGKIGIPDSILMKPSRLTDEEYEIIKMHPILSYEMIKGIGELKGSLDAIKYHHERMDGSGYPEGISGDDIPLPARILAVADTFDAMTSDRIYRKAMKREEALKEIVKLSGKFFDQNVVHAAVPIFKGECALIEKRDYLMLKEIESRRLDYFFRDHLTGAFNRNAFEFIYSKISHERKQFCIVAVDIVKLREINLKFGWSYGDELLKKLVVELNRSFNPFAAVRYSGDNFVIFIDSSMEDGEIVERVREVESRVGTELHHFILRDVENREQVMKELTRIEHLGHDGD